LRIENPARQRPEPVDHGIQQRTTRPAGTMVKVQQGCPFRFCGYVPARRTEALNSFNALILHELIPLVKGPVSHFRYEISDLRFEQLNNRTAEQSNVELRTEALLSSSPEYSGLGSILSFSLTCLSSHKMFQHSGREGWFVFIMLPIAFIYFIAIEIFSASSDSTTLFDVIIFNVVKISYFLLLGKHVKEFARLSLRTILEGNLVFIYHRLVKLIETGDTITFVEMETNKTNKEFYIFSELFFQKAIIAGLNNNENDSVNQLVN
jgi:hypothetical protein